MITLYNSVNRVQRKLDDEDSQVWTRAQIENFIQDGYDQICRDSECIFDMVMFDDQPLAGNYTRDFERDYITDFPILARFNYTKDSDREYVGSNMRGPVNHTKPSDASYMTDTDEAPTARRVGYLPDGFVSIDRVTHDWIVLVPESARYLRKSRNIYDTEQGGVYSYSMDQDGLWTLRTVGVPTATVSSRSVQGTFGVIRQFSDSEFDWDDETVIGPSTYGIIRSVPQHFASGARQGVIRRITPDDSATRVELYRLGNKLTSHPFEVPDRVVKYIEWWAMFRAYSTPGEGENRQMAEHFRQRYQTGVERLKRRVDEQMRERTAAMGQKRTGELDSYLERFPSDYGYKVPFRRR